MMDRLELRVTPPWQGRGPDLKRMRLAARRRERAAPVARAPSRSAAAIATTLDAGFLWREVACYCGLAEAAGSAPVRAMAADLAEGCEAAARKIERHAARGRAQARIK